MGRRGDAREHWDGGKGLLRTGRGLVSEGKKENVSSHARMDWRRRGVLRTIWQSLGI